MGRVKGVRVRKERSRNHIKMALMYEIIKIQLKIHFSVIYRKH